MKFLAILIILTAVGLFGTAFFGIYTAPGLEEIPTVDSSGLKNKEAKEKAATGANPDKKPSGIFPVNSNGKISERNNYLNQNKGKVAPGE
jgi:hypothetical protein